MSTPPPAGATRLPLEGLRILSAEQFGAGPWGTMLLADLGAEIIKIENPATDGDVARHVPPFTGDRDSIYFQSFNRNKKSLTLNLQHPKAVEILHPLVRQSAGVFNNMRGDLPAKMGLDYAALGAVNPAIVCCSLSAFGRTGPRASEPGYDYLMQAYTGWMTLTGEPGSPPQKTGLSLVDLSGGVMAVLGMLSAICRARLTGLGCDVDVNLFDTALSELGYVAAWHLSKAYQPQRLPDSSHPSLIPSQVMPTQDGWITIMCAKEKFYRNLVGLLGAPELAEDPRFRTFGDRLKNAAVLLPLLKDLTRKKTTREWLVIFKDKVPCAPVNTVEEAFRDPQAAADGMILEVPHPEFGTVRMAASPIKIGPTEIQHRRAPRLGEDTDALLAEYLQLTPAQISAYRKDGVL